MDRLLNIVRQFHRLLSASAQKSGQGNVPQHRESLVLNDDVTDLSALEGLTTLTRLVAYKAPSTHLSPLRGCRFLTHLRLNVAHVADLSPLADLPSLESLDLWSYGGQALWPHAGIQRLCFVHAAERSADLAPLVTWKALSSLSLERATIKGALPVLPPKSPARALRHHNQSVAIRWPRL